MHGAARLLDQASSFHFSVGMQYAGADPGGGSGGSGPPPFLSNSYNFILQSSLLMMKLHVNFHQSKDHLVIGCTLYFLVYQRHSNKAKKSKISSALRAGGGTSPSRTLPLAVALRPRVCHLIPIILGPPPLKFAGSAPEYGRSPASGREPDH